MPLSQHKERALLADQTKPSAGDPRWIELQFPDPATDRLRRIVVLAVSGVVIAILITTAILALRALGFRGPAWIMSVFAAAAVAGVGLLIWDVLAVRRRIRMLTSESQTPRGAAEQVVAQLAGKDRMNVFSALARQLAQRHGAVAVRVSEDRQPAVEPLRDPFEPAPLDETDAAVMDLMNDEPAPGARPTGPREPTDDLWIGRWLQRQGRVGGLVMLVLFGILFLRSAWDAWVAGRPSLSFYLFLAAILLQVLGPFGGAGRNPLVTPGGLVLWAPEGGLRFWRMRRRLVAASTHTLCVFHITNQQWGWAVSDGASGFSGVCTETEAQFLLRAWRSPLTPPTLEQIAAIA